MFSFKSHSSVKRTIYQRTTPKNSDFKEKVNTAKVNNVTTAGTKAVVSLFIGHVEMDVKSLACLDLETNRKKIFDSGCSRHMTGNKSYLTDYQDIDGGFVAFAGSLKGGGFVDDAGKEDDAQLFETLNSAIQSREYDQFSEENTMEPKKGLIQALTDPKWIDKALQEESFCNLNFKRFGLLGGSSYFGKRVIGKLSWLYRNQEKMREELESEETRQDSYTMVYTQGRGIDYDVGFCSVARIEAIRPIERGGVWVANLLVLQIHSSLIVQQKEDGISISQDKYVAEILKKFDFATVKTASTPMEPNKALVKDEKADNSPFDLEAFLDSDYVGASLDRKSKTGGCQFLGKRLISWQCKKQTIVANSTTEAEYVAAANCCGQGRLMVYKCSGLYTSAIWIEVGRIVLPGLLYAAGQKLVLSGIELVLPGKLSTAGLPLEEVLLGISLGLTVKSTIYYILHSSFGATVKEDAGGYRLLPMLYYILKNWLRRLGDMSHHKKTYVNPSHTMKIFANIKREGKDFSGRVTPLFATMMVQANQEEGVDSDIPTNSQQTPIISQPSSSKPQKKKSMRKQRKDSALRALY
ncbi:hypothetical protein Tco_1134241 [Tanacetum coccineum]